MKPPSGLKIYATAYPENDSANANEAFPCGKKTRGHTTPALTPDRKKS